MVRALLKSAGNILGYPFVLLPAVAGALVNYFVLLATYFSAVSIAADIVEFGLPNFSMAELPFRFYSLHAGELSIVFLGLLANLVVFGVLLLFYARFVKLKKDGKPSIGSAFSYALSRIGSVFSAIVFFAVVSLFLAGLLWGMLLLAAAGLPFIEFVTALYVLLLLYLAVKLVMVLPIMGYENAGLKEAIAKSWFFSTKHFLGTVLVILLLAFVYAVLTAIGSFAMEPLADDFQIIAVYYFFTNILVSAVSGLMLAEHYAAGK